MLRRCSLARMEHPRSNRYLYAARRTAGCVASPLELGANDSDQLQITLQGTGLRGFSGVANVAARIGGSIASVVSISSGSDPGVDQVKLIVSRSLAGAGEVSIVLTVDGQTANVVTIAIQ